MAKSFGDSFDELLSCINWTKYTYPYEMTLDEGDVHTIVVQVGWTWDWDEHAETEYGWKTRREALAVARECGFHKIWWVYCGIEGMPPDGPFDTLEEARIVAHEEQQKGAS